ncbi:hypothetical protein [Paraburkholderia sp. BL23I1N1]|uniref:hypothetical protein n=1 Tax=Paraburkholderia sp. BL23I1N1 TaxID=1938802 RepID=UPI000E7501B3|nr:hypothetical protein [Paraburkholderia sp. BL23I1N1]
MAAEIEFYRVAKMDAAASEAEASQTDCSVAEAQTKRILAYNSVLENYASALSAISQDNYVTVNGEVKDVDGILSSLNSAKLTAVTADQKSAVEAIVGFVGTAALEVYRHAKIADALSPQNVKAAKEISAAIRSAVHDYDAQLAQEGKAYDVAITAVSVVASNERLAVQEYLLRMTDIQSSLSQRRQAVDAYNKALASMGTALDAAAADVVNPSFHEISDSVVSYAKQAYAVQVSFRKAFIN